ncbi:MFS transporter [Algicella marina]|uniref:MFS transporter n=1 Tax=Algicella marina TaxID=2683284 RepID=A0A6P1T1H3_9RHOB|nr:MFS transporter [Algicella marina]QHQ36588.1 MFS transporter [Algicella marina]
MARLQFLRDNAPWLTAGALLTFGSSFGQTYFISIYSGVFREEFDLSHTAWGSVYAIGTLASAVAVLMLGGLADRYRTRLFATIIMLMFAGVCLVTSRINAAWALPFVIFGLRFCGQGMMSHIAMVSVGRWFAAARGRAVSIAALGFSAGEALLPLGFVALMGVVGWRASWMVAAAVLMVMIVVLRMLLRNERHPKGEAEIFGSVGMDGRQWSRGDALRHWLFWVTLPGFLAQPVFGTAFFFQQVHLTEIKGWPLAGFVSLFPIYTASSVASLLVGGWLVDRFGAGRVLPFYLLPLAAGFCVVAAAPSLTVAAFGLLLIGLMQGTSAATVGAYWPEYYGTRHLGAIRAVVSAFLVFASALGPAITGYLIDFGVDYRKQLVGMAAYCVVMSFVLGLAMAATRRTATVTV